MSGKEDITTPIRYSDEVVVVSPEDWNVLVDLFIQMQSDVSNLQSRVTTLEGYHP